MKWRSAAPTESFVRRLVRVFVRLSIVCVVALFVLIAGFFVWRWYDRRGPVEPTEIYPGIVYRCIRLPDTYESAGLVHVCEIDLSQPGLDLYATPVEPTLHASGWEYYLRRVSTVCDEQDLSVVVNGTLFMTPSHYFPLPGDPGALETLVSNHQLNHDDPNSYLIWFSDDLTPHLAGKLPGAEVLGKAKWAIGIQEISLIDGKPRGGTNETPDRRTMIAFNEKSRKLWLAVFEHASYRSSAELLGELGASFGGTLDGGSSTAMALGSGARGVRSGLLLGGLRPVATQFGVRVAQRK